MIWEPIVSLLIISGHILDETHICVCLSPSHSEPVAVHVYTWPDLWLFVCRYLDGNVIGDLDENTFCELEYLSELSLASNLLTDDKTSIPTNLFSCHHHLTTLWVFLWSLTLYFYIKTTCILIWNNHYFWCMWYNK